jgi:hypothetical protein
MASASQTLKTMKYMTAHQKYSDSMEHNQPEVLGAKVTNKICDYSLGKCDGIRNIAAIGGRAVRNWWMRAPSNKAQPCTMRPHYILFRAPTSKHPAENLEVFQSYERRASRNWHGTLR